MSLAITHAGPAHADEFIALAILVAYNFISKIERRDPTPEELNDPDIWVIDVGGKHQPEFRNFDHHGVPGTEGKCAFDLVLEHLGLREDAIKASPWLEFKSSIDCAGPKLTAEKFGMSVPNLYATLSPIETQLLKCFENHQRYDTADWVFNALSVVGVGLVTYWDMFQDDLVKFEKAKPICVNDLLFLDFRDCGPLLDAVMTYHMDEVGAAGSVTIDNHGPDCEKRVVLYRHNDHPRVDFRRIDATRMHFVHHNGFIAKTLTGENSTEHIVDLLKIAVE